MTDDVSDEDEKEYHQDAEKPWIPKIANDRKFKRVINDLLDYN